MDKKDIKQQIARMIADAYYDVLLTGFEEQEKRFVVTLSVIDYLATLKEKKIKYSLIDVFTDTIVNQMYVEADNYIGRK
ncbi:MAG TPA: hypothetical protein DCE23_09075 [Firmicutes bacterium]|nr:hypothetical protein [Bacillota bacterium]